MNKKLSYLAYLIITILIVSTLSIISIAEETQSLNKDLLETLEIVGSNIGGELSGNTITIFSGTISSSPSRDLTIERATIEFTGTNYPSSNLNNIRITDNQITGTATSNGARVGNHVLNSGDSFTITSSEVIIIRADGSNVNVPGLGGNDFSYESGTLNLPDNMIINLPNNQGGATFNYQNGNLQSFSVPPGTQINLPQELGGLNIRANNEINFAITSNEPNPSSLGEAINIQLDTRNNERGAFNIHLPLNSELRINSPNPEYSLLGNRGDDKPNLYASRQNAGIITPPFNYIIRDDNNGVHIDFDRDIIQIGESTSEHVIKWIKESLGWADDRYKSSTWDLPWE